ncbi:hypothetical protein HZB97_02600 [Candidatus Gottesmanbacteria bacterium]|nr:hypothetical protein [Candidatus Gottesmanbacteria bacterium]
MPNPANEQKLKSEFGSIPQISDFIEKYMVPGKPTYIEKAGLDPREAINLIHDVGGIAVLAHPCFDVPVGDTATIKVLRDWGIDGIEAIAPFKTIEETRPKIDYFTQIAKKCELLITGGSDYHGIDGIGAGLGLLEWGMKIEDEILENIKDYYHSLTQVSEKGQHLLTIV